MPSTSPDANRGRVKATPAITGIGPALSSSSAIRALSETLAEHLEIVRAVLAGDERA
jgi:hypothetical protein